MSQIEKPKKNPFTLIWWHKGLTPTQIERNNYLYWKWEKDHNNFKL